MNHLAYRSFEKIVAPFVPRSQRLAYEGWLRDLLGYEEKEISVLDRLVDSRRTAIDAGANRGVYTYAMSRIFESVWSFEPNSEVSRPIREANIINVTFIGVALSSSPGRAMLRIPVKNGQPLPGWATLGTSPIAPESYQEMAVPMATLDSFAITGVSFIKIDVEGHEALVLQGAREIITRDRPVCLIEANSGDTSQLENFFESLHAGYSMHRERNGVCLSPQNVLFTPTS